MDCSTTGFPVLYYLLEFAQTHVHWLGNAIQTSPLLLPPSPASSTRVFSNESALCIRWPKYWTFSFSISPFNEYSRLISFRMDWFDLLAAKGLSRVFSSTTVQKHQFFSTQPLCSNSHIRSISDLIPESICHFHCIIMKDLIYVIPEWPSGFPYFPFFADCIELLHL